MIKKSTPNSNSASTKRKLDQLNTCVRYCEDEFRCRRTMQLEFFGETFDRQVCGRTCDNCKAGREPDKMNMTSEARTILNLVTEMNRLKPGWGITLGQLCDLYRGSGSQAIKKLMPHGRKIEELKNYGYGHGSKYKKFEVDRVLHTMIFERLLTENSVDTKTGFSVDLVNTGEKAEDLLHGGRQLIVEVPKAKLTTVETTAKKTASKEKTRRKSSPKTATTKKKKAPPSKTVQAPIELNDSYDMEIDGGLKFAEGGDDVDASSGDESWHGGSGFQSARPSTTNKGDSPAVLPQDHVAELARQIKKLTNMWASEEQMCGNQTFCKFTFPR